MVSDEVVPPDEVVLPVVPEVVPDEVVPDGVVVLLDEVVLPEGAALSVSDVSGVQVNSSIPSKGIPSERLQIIAAPP